jgi:hypothetical protein
MSKSNMSKVEMGKLKWWKSKYWKSECQKQKRRQNVEFIWPLQTTPSGVRYSLQLHMTMSVKEKGRILWHWLAFIKKLCCHLANSTPSQHLFKVKFNVQKKRF